MKLLSKTEWSPDAQGVASSMTFSLEQLKADRLASERHVTRMWPT